MTIDQFIFNCEEASNEQTLFNLLHNQVKSLGFDFCVFSLLTNHPDLNLPISRGLFVSSMSSWVQELNQGQFDDVDPFRSHCFYGHGVLTLSALKTSDQLSAAQIKFIQSTESRGFHDRVTVALKGAGGAVASVDLGRELKVRPPTRQTLHKLNALCQHFYLAYCQLKSSAEAFAYMTLTGKEREVLEWSAKGFTKAEIGVQLHISSHTVDYHSRKLARKLGARNITAAAVNALNRGLIHVSY